MKRSGKKPERDGVPFLRDAFLIMLISFLALGCVQKEVKTDPNDGLKITEFIIDLDDIESGDPFIISALVENVGGTTASNVNFFVFGISWESKTPALLQGKTLRPPDVARNIAGGVTFGQKQFIAPQLPEGITHKFTFTGRAYYDYSTTGTVSIPVLNKPEFDRKRQRNEALPTMSVENSDAPIKVDFIGSSPIIADEGEFFYKIVLKNTGSGIPITKDITGLITGTINIIGGGTFVNCLNSGGGSSLTLPQNKNGVLLRRGESVTVPCSIKLDVSKWQQTPQGTLLIRFDLKYRYFTEKEGVLTVHGARKKAIAGPGEPTPTPTPTPVPTPVPGVSFCGDAGGSCKSDCETNEYHDARYSCENEGDGICCIAVPGARPTDCGFLPVNTPGCPVMGLYRYSRGSEKPFGHWCTNIIDEVITYYECYSGCYGDFYKDIAITPENFDYAGTPQKDECR